MPTTAPSSLSPCLSSQGTLEGLEEELLAFFSVTPHSVYTALMDNRYFPISGEMVSGVPCAPGLPQAAEGFWKTQETLAWSPCSPWGRDAPGDPCVGACGTWCSPCALWVPGRTEGRAACGTPWSDTLALTLSPLPQL